jgi:hypothetical protein
MKRLLITLGMVCTLVIPAFAQSTGADANRNTLQRVFAQLATPDGRGRLIQAITGIPAEKVQRAEQLRANSDMEVRRFQAEINIRKAELTRVLLDSKPDMNRVQKILKEALDWEYKLRLAEIERDVKVRELLGDRNWGRYREARRFLGDLDRIRLQRLADDQTGGNLRTPENRSLSPSEQQLLRRLERVESRLGKGQ